MSGYARLTPKQARAAIIGLLLLVGLCLAYAPPNQFLAQSRSKAQIEGSRGSDLELYRIEMDRIYAGQSYYQAAGGELRLEGYPTRSVFNWRFPTMFWVLGTAGSFAAGKLILCGLGLLLCMAGYIVLREHDLPHETADPQEQARSRPLCCKTPHKQQTGPQGSRSVSILTGGLLTSIAVTCMSGDVFLYVELWSGVLIGLSLCAFGFGRSWLGVTLAVIALLFRELAMPYCLVAMLLALRYQRWTELLQWCVGLSFFAACYGLHSWHVSTLIRPDDLAHADGWVQFGGLPLVISMIQANTYLIMTPGWVAGLVLTATIFGFAGWTTPLGQRAGLAAAAFIVAFLFVGQEVNQYWGLLWSPLLCFGAGRFPISLHDVCRAASTKT